MEYIILKTMLILTVFHGTIIAAKLDLTPTRFKNVRKTCTTKHNKPGICVAESSCNDNQEIERHGVIDESELRIQSECTKPLEWCCSEKSIKKDKEGTTSASTGTDGVTTESTSTTTTTSATSTTSSTTTTTTPATTTTSSTTTTTTPTSTSTQASKKQDDDQPRCTVGDGSDCPWCVNLFSVDGDFWCMGSLIGSNVVLTAATCVLHMEDQKLFARVPESADPNANYLVKFRLKHPDYNSGSRKNDLALLTIDGVQWGPNGGKGACYSTEHSFGPDCVGAGVDSDDVIALTNLTIEEGSCNGRGSKTDMACGKSVGDCYVQDGAPIMCPVDNNAYVMMGIAKYSCGPQGSLLGSLKSSETWLMNSLKGVMGLEEKDFLYTLNY